MPLRGNLRPEVGTRRVPATLPKRRSRAGRKLSTSDYKLRCLVERITQRTYDEMMSLSDYEPRCLVKRPRKNYNEMLSTSDYEARCLVKWTTQKLTMQCFSMSDYDEIIVDERSRAESSRRADHANVLR